jgi:pyrimidine deaminase RibD-like protein
VLGEAFRGERLAGQHAEYTLLEQKLATARLAGTTLFTTLEPCTSRNHPKIPCADRIIERKIKRVVIGMLDPNEQICGRGAKRLRAAGIEIALFDPDLVTEIEELNRDFSRLHPLRRPKRRTKSQTIDPVRLGETGPNGHRIGYTKNGDKVEWVPDEDRRGKEWPLLLRRNDKAILREYNELWEKIWWDRHQVWLEEIKRAERPLSKERRNLLRTAKRAAKEIERKYGRKNLKSLALDWGELEGRMSALAWVLGSEWDESRDT